MPLLLIATIGFGVAISSIFNGGEASEAIANSWFVVGAIYFLIYHWNGFLRGKIYLWSAGTYRRKQEPIQFKVWILINSLLGILAIVIGVANILGAL